MRLQFCWLFLFSFLCFSTRAQQNRFIQLVAGELNSDTFVNVVHQDQQGFLWFGTKNGLFRYNGQEMITYRNSPRKINTLNHNLISTLAETNQHLWVGTWGNGNEVNQVDKLTGAISRIRLEKDINTAYSVSLALHDGSLMIGGAQSICHLLPNSKQHDIFISDRVQAFWEDTDHTVWAASQEGNLLHFRTDKHQLVLLDSIRQNYKIRLIVSDKQGQVWFATDKGLKLWRGSRHTIPEVLKNKDILSLCAVRDGSLWIGTQEDGLFRWESKSGKVEHFTSDERPDYLHNNTIQYLFEDQSHLLWIGTEKGLYFTDLIPSPFEQILFTDTQGNDGLPLYVDTNDLLWIGGQKFVWFYDQATQRFLSEKIPSIGNSQILPVRDGGIWITARHVQKVLPYVPSKKIQVLERLVEMPQKPVFKPGFFVMTTLEDTARNMWFGMYFQGVSMREHSGRWHHYGKDVINGIAVSRIIEARDGTIWIGKWDSGVSYLVGGNWRNPKFEHLIPGKGDDNPGMNRLSYPVISDLMEDRSGNIWIATFGGGVNVLNPKTKKIRVLSEDDGLPSNSVLTVMEDNMGMIWMSTLNGLARLDPNTDRFVTYKTKDGLPSDAFMFLSKAKNAKGELFWGTRDHIVKLDPAKLIKKNDQFPVYLTSLKLFNRPVTPSSDGIIERQLMFTRQITVPYSKAMLTLDFASLYFRNPAQVQYAYQLKGFDKSWNYVGNQRAATYTYPNPNTYEFHVKASLDGHYWTTLAHPLIITIKPEWYQTLWFRFGILLLLFGGLLGLYLYRIHILRQRQKAELGIMTRTQEAERKRFAEDLHDGLGANLSMLKLYLDMLEDPKIPVPELKQRSENLLNESLSDLRRLIHDLSPRTLTGIGFVNALHELIQRINATEKLRVTYEATGFTDKLESTLEIHLYRMTQELLQNALKHSKANNIDITLSSTGDLILLVYQDNGVGFDPVKVGPDSSGLLNIQHRTQLLNGRCEIISQPGIGTEVRIEIPN